MPANNQINDNIAKAFEPDYLNRKALAAEWTDALLSTKINHHLVISVSGDWGTGKTYLAKNWHKYLEEQKYFTCYIDAHKKDYAEDPLLVFIEELNSNINQYYKENMGWWWKVRNKIPVLKNKVPKFLMNSSAFIGGVEVGLVINAIRILIQLTQNFLSNKIKDKLKYFALYEKYISDFKAALTKFTNLFPKPVVIFIDELDRSNPKFVIKLIEQLKHIFEIPNLAFILTVNKKELSNTIKGIYGSKMDGYAYYKKFTTHDFTLYPISELNNDNIKIYIQEITNKYNDFIISNNFLDIAVIIIQLFNLSLRDIEQVLDHLYYIKEKVTQEYHKEYLIICFLYRTVYIKYYTSFINYRDILESINISLLAQNENDAMFSMLYNDLLNASIHFSNNSKYYQVLTNIFSEIDDKAIKDILQVYDSAKYFPINYPEQIEYSYRMEFIGIPIVCKGIDKYNRPVFYDTIEEVRENILSIRKNLIQLSMLGAVPKDNIVK